MTSSPPLPVPELAARLNESCHCTTLDRAALAQGIGSGSGDAALLLAALEARPYLFSPTMVFVAPARIADMRGIVAAVEQAVIQPAWREQALARAPDIARVDAGARGVFLGYDFHLGPDGARLIEINTNAGGGLLNALLGRAQRDCCLPPRRPELERVYLEMFLAEWHAARGTRTLTTVAIVDDAPAEQYLFPEFLLFRDLFRRHGLHAVIADAGSLVFRDGALWYEEQRIDLVYNRLTDFYLEAPEHAALRTAYETGAVVLTPHPRAHALYADKRNLTRLSDPDFLRALGLSATTMETLARGVPRTVTVDATHAEALWAARRRWFFKPAAGYGAKAAYRGDKLTRRVWSEILAADYVAQETVPPSARTMQINGARQDFKLDIRAYVYDGAIQVFAARLYQGQTTNFRTPGGGFAPVVTVPDEIALLPGATGRCPEAA